MKFYKEQSNRCINVPGCRLCFIPPTLPGGLVNSSSVLATLPGSLVNSLFVLSILLCGLVNLPYAQTGTINNELQIEESILDYVEGVYEADTARIYRSVHPTLVKRGTWYDNQIEDYVPLDEMDFRQLVQLTKTWNSDGRNADSSSPREITIYDVQDKTASAKLTAVWGTDYFHLAKLNGKWFIINVLWQTHEREQASTLLPENDN